MKTKAEVTSTQTDLEYYFGFNIKLLSSIGLKFSTTVKTDKFTFLHKLPTYIFLLDGFFLFVLQMNFIRFTIRTNTLLTIQILTQMISNWQSVSKAYFMLKKIEDIQNVLEMLGTLWGRYPLKESDADLLKPANKMIFLTKVYWGVALSLIGFYCLPLIIKMFIQYRDREMTNHTYDYSQTILLLKCPFEITRKSTFLFLLSQEVYLLFGSAVYWICSDTLFAQFTTHICLQFKILQRNTREAFDRGALRSVIDIIRRQRELLKICGMTQDIYSLIIFSTMLFSAMNMCVNIVGVRETISKGLYLESGIHVFLFIVTFAQIFLFCIFGELISGETTSLADLAYNLEWTKDPKLGPYIQLIILRAQKPFYCTAFGFFPIGHTKLTSIINSTFSYYMLLQTVS